MMEKLKEIKLRNEKAFVSITNRGLRFSKGLVSEMGNPKYVLLLMDTQDKIVGLKECDNSAANSIEFAKESNKKMPKLFNKKFIESLSRLMKWNLNLNGYHVFGEWNAEEKVMIFDLNNAEIMKKRLRRQRQALPFDTYGVIE